MLMKVEPLAGSLEAIARRRLRRQGDSTVTQGQPLTEQRAQELARWTAWCCYAGATRHRRTHHRRCVVDEKSPLDYVFVGGDACAIGRPGCGNPADPRVGMRISGVRILLRKVLDCRNYTRPERVEERRVREVLLSGNHEMIRRWRRQAVLWRTGHVGQALL